MNYILYSYFGKICCKNKTEIQMYFKIIFLPWVDRPNGRPGGGLDHQSMCISGYYASRLSSLSIDCKPNNSLFCSVDQPVDRHYPRGINMTVGGRSGGQPTRLFGQYLSIMTIILIFWLVANPKWLYGFFLWYLISYK